MQFEIKRTTRDYVIIRIGGEYEQHSHFKDKREALELIKLLVKNIRPSKRYWQVAAKRLLTKEEYEGLTIKRKQQYYNVGLKGNVKCYK